MKIVALIVVASFFALVALVGLDAQTEQSTIRLALSMKGDL